MALALPDMLGEVVCLCGGTGLRQWGGDARPECRCGGLLRGMIFWAI